MEDAHVCSVQLAREYVRGTVPDVDRVHGTVLPDASAGLLGDYLLSFVRRAGTLSTHVANRSAVTVVELLGVAMAGVSLSTRADEVQRRMRAEAHIAGRLGDPSLDADAVAAGIGTSRSALYRAFDADGGVASHIQRQRLEGLRKALLRARDDRPVVDLLRAFGFVSESHCSRAFAAAFGKPPKRYRDDVRRIRQPDASGGPASVIMRWATELY